MARRVLLALGLTLALGRAAAARGFQCAGATWVLSDGSILGRGAAVVIDDRRFATIPGTCDVPRRAVERRLHAGTGVRVRWRACGALGTVRLVGTIGEACARLTGTLRVGGARLPFDGTLALPPPPTTTTLVTTTSTTSTTATTTTTSTTATTTTLVGLPDDITGFDVWLRLNVEPIPIHPVGDAHYGTKDVYANQTRETLAPGGVQQLPYPDGTILVKASTRPGRDFIGLVSIMRKRAGADPEHGDWQWVEYGRASGDEPFVEVGRDAVCWTCHGIREPWDWVYTRLE